MKRISYILVLLAVSVACQKTESPYINVEQDSYEVPDTYTELNIPVSANVASRAHIEYDGEDTDWIFLLPSVLDGTGVYSLWIDAYEGVLEERTATLVITAEGLVRKVGVTQLPRNAIGITPENFASISPSGTFPVEIICGKEWTAVPEDDTDGWLTLDKTSGDGPETINVTVQELAGDSDVRTGHVTFTSGELTARLTVQHGYAQKIGDLIWSKANVGEPGFFVSAPDDKGMLYQYNSMAAWPNSCPETSPCPEGMPVGQVDNGAWDWARDNDPCPDGWRIPSADEIKALVGNPETEHPTKKFKWMDVSSGIGFSVPGAVCGIPSSEAGSATRDDMKGGIFLPQSGYRDKDTGEQNDTWSATMTSRTRPGQTWDLYTLWIDSSDSFGLSWNGNRSAYPVRCVADKE